jgi:superfamily II DNA or RNA helicase
MDVDTWQAGLRREFGRAQRFRCENIGAEAVFSEYAVTNPQKGTRYRVAIRGSARGDNYCSCPDFSTNALGTCKHVEFVLKKLERQAGKRALKAGFHPAYSEIHLHYGPVRHLRWRPGRDCPPPVRAFAARLFDEHGVLRPGCEPRVARLLKLGEAAGHAIRHYPDGDAHLALLADDRRRRAALARLCPTGAEHRLFATLVKTTLSPYQRAGAWFAANAGRAIIADEMGLGKTVQAIAAAALLKRVRQVQRVLVVCPASVVHQWQAEISRFTGWSTAVINGTVNVRAALWRESNAEVLIAAYDVVVRDHAAVDRWSPDLLIVDEAQRIKNWRTRAAQTLKRLRAPLAIVLTGTPLENRLEDLHSIVEFVDRHRLGALFRFLHRHQVIDAGGKVTGYRDLNAVAEQLSGVLIRRRRAEVLTQLPGRHDETCFVELAPEQRAVHEEYAQQVAELAAKWRRFHHLTEGDQRRLTAALQTMRMVCDSTYLVDGLTDVGAKAGVVERVLREITSEAGAKVVVFSAWLRMHALIAKRLDKLGLGHVHFHGGVPTRDRQALVQRFRDDPRCRVFLAGDAAAVGLNLQHAAAAVINVDLPWNPAVLEQRIGRVHRLGQTKPVRVVNVVAKDSIEQRIMGLLGTKRSLAAGILDAGDDTIDLGGDRMKRFMADVEAATQPQPAAASTSGPVEEKSARSSARRTSPAPVADAATVAKRLAALVGVGAGSLGVVVGADGRATVTLSPEVLARLGIG